MSFNLVVSAGHCGTKWLAHCLHQQDGVQAHHELRQLQAGAPWFECGKHPPTESYGYFNTIRSELECNDEVWDALSWFPWEIDAVSDIVPVDDTIYLIRNGILQLESLITTSSWKSQHFSFWAYQVWLPHWHTAWAATTPRALPLEFFSREERLCLLIAGSLAWSLLNPDWRVFRLEDLLKSVDDLGSLVDLPDVELRDLQELDINRHTKGVRDPVSVWASWSKMMQVAYTNICGPMMNAYGYELPEVTYA